MALARKNLLGHMLVKSDNAMKPCTAGWEASHVKALEILVQMLRPNYQAMVRESKTALDAWETLCTFFVQKNLHYRVQLRKQIHGFEMVTGENWMNHLLRFEELCFQLSAVGGTLTENEKLLIWLDSVPALFDEMIKTIEAHESVTLLDAKEMPCREFETLTKREEQEEPFKSIDHGTYSNC